MRALRFALLLVVLASAATVDARAAIQEPQATPARENPTVTLKVDSTPPNAAPDRFSETLKALAAVLAAIAWPAVFAIVIITHRNGVTRILEALIVLVGSSKHIKLGDMIDVEVERSAEQAERRAPTREIPTDELEAANRVSGLVNQSELPIVRAKLLGFAREYESTRSNMKPGPERTKAMNAIVAKMRTLSLAAKPLLNEFATAENSAGMRLVAITILQLSPELSYFEWLVDRMRKEQPFLFFHASLAILATVRSYGSIAKNELRAAITKALEIVTSFKEGPPDQNTIDILDLALSELNSTSVRSPK